MTDILSRRTEKPKAESGVGMGGMIRLETWGTRKALVVAAIGASSEESVGY
jgi:hypothetical protein